MVWTLRGEMCPCRPLRGARVLARPAGLARPLPPRKGLQGHVTPNIIASTLTLRSFWVQEHCKFISFRNPGTLGMASALDHLAALTLVVQYQRRRCLVNAAPRNSAYDTINGQWLSQELPRLLSLQKNMGDGLVLTRGSWRWKIREANHYQFLGLMRFYNITTRNELFVSEVQSNLRLLSKGSIETLSSKVLITSNHPDGKPAARNDNYWAAYITRAGECTAMEVRIDVRDSEQGFLQELQALCIELKYNCYGPHGNSLHSQHVVLPVYDPVSSSKHGEWQQVGDNLIVLPIYTHLLSHIDCPLQVIKTYILPHAEDGDMIAIGETPLAIMQGRYRHPCTVQPGVLARLACRLFLPTSSLATACGMQTLIDIVGSIRVVFAVFVAIAARLLGIRGMFYRLAGEQARLIDDVSGTLPPYDQYITLGPVHAQSTVDALEAKTGFGIAVVDVNDLRQVQILAASKGVNCNTLAASLVSNPAGNADEQTPFVLVRRQVK